MRRIRPLIPQELPDARRHAGAERSFSRLPANGILKFSSFTADGNFTIGFSRNAANTR
jgi:hypothetical protein